MKNRTELKDLARRTVAGMIQVALDEGTDNLREIHHLSEEETRLLEREIRAIQKRIDPYYPQAVL
jgi:hypothetical protein